MEYTINWSPEAAALLKAGEIQIDRFKCPDWDTMIADAEGDAPVYVHFPLVVGRGTLATTDWARIDALMAATNTPHVNLHLEPLKSVLGLDDNGMIAHCIREVEAVVARYGSANVVLENVPYRADQVDKYRAAVLPDVINRIIREANCGLLLDIGHARISARTLGMDVRDYLAALPLDRLGELHVAGVTTFTQAHLDKALDFPGFKDYFKKYEGQQIIGTWIDHFGMESDDDWTYLAWVMDRVRDGVAQTPRFVSYEYGGIGAPFGWRSERAVIARDVPKMYGMVHGEKTRA